MEQGATVCGGVVKDIITQCRGVARGVSADLYTLLHMAHHTNQYIVKHTVGCIGTSAARDLCCFWLLTFKLLPFLTLNELNQ